MGREIDLFNELHRLVFDLVTYQLRDGAQRASSNPPSPRFAPNGERSSRGWPSTGTGSLDPVTLRRNIVMGEIGAYSRGLGRLLEIEAAQAKSALGEKKAAIIQDGLIALREQQMQKAAPRP